ncbi:ribonuclease H-like domain-containing protein [Tanacetum coccineum]
MGMVLFQSLQIHQDKLRFCLLETAEEKVAREKREKKQRTTCYLPLQNHLAKFHKMTDAKEMWDAIKSRFGGNDESKKMQKYILKQQFEGFSVSNTEGLHKGYDRFQSLLSQLEIHGAGVSTEDANQKFLRSLPSAWSQWQLAMLSMRMKKFYKKTGRKLQFDAKEAVGFDKTKVECYNCHKTGHFARECRLKGTQDNRRNAWNSGNKDGSRTGQKEDSKALVTIDGEGVDWTNHSEDEDYALMACNSSDSDTEIENQPLNDRFADGMHAVPPRMTGNYMPSGPEIEVDYSQFTYGSKQTQPSKTESQSSEIDTCESNISAEPSELVTEPVVNESNVESQPKVWSDAPIIEEYESDSEDEENVKSQFIHSQKPKVDKKDLGYGFAVRACFVCGSLNHLIRDCDFHEKRMARKAELNNVNTARTSGTKNFSTARQSFNRQTVPTSTAMKVNTVKPIVNRVRPAKVFHKTHSPSSRPFKRTTVLRTDFSNQKLNTAKDYPHRALKNKGIVDSGCSRHMTGNKAYLAEFQDFNGGPVAFGGSKGYITGKGKIKTGKLDFEDVCFVKELQHFNLFSVSQMCDKKNKVLFTDSECLVLTTTKDVMESVVQNGIRGNTVNKPELHNKKEFAERKNSTLIEAARPCLQIHSYLTLLAEAYRTACYDLNRMIKRRVKRAREQTFMDELERLKRQEKEAHEEAEALRKKFETLVIKEGAAKPSRRIVAVSDTKSLGLSRFASWVEGYRTKAKRKGIYYDEVFAPEARLEAIRSFQAFASYMGYISIKGCEKCLLYGENNEEVPPFETTEAFSQDEEAGCEMSISIGFRNSRTGGCQFLGRRLISWQCKKQTIVATSTTEAEYVAAASCCGLIDRFRRVIERRVIDGTEAIQLPTMFTVFDWDKCICDQAQCKVSTKLGKVCTSFETNKEKYRKHNMVAYLEKSEGNEAFHEIIDFLKKSSIHHALTVSPVVSTIFVEQFCNVSLRNKTINIMLGTLLPKISWQSSVSISEASIRSELLFDDAKDKLKHYFTPRPAPTSEVPHESPTDSSPVHTSEVPLEQQTNPSPRPSPTTTIPDSIPETSGGNLGSHSSSDKSLIGNEVTHDYPRNG